MGAKTWGACLAFALGLLLPAGVEASAPGHILLWTRADGSLPVLRQAAARFAARTGIPVEVTAPTSMLDKFQILAETHSGPDVVIWAHDRVGEWVEAGLIAPVEPRPPFKRRLQDIGWQAFSVGGKQWGYPLALESAALIVNTQLVQRAPERFEDIPPLERHLAAKGVKALLWDYTNAYYSWAMLSAGLDPNRSPSASIDDPLVYENAKWLNGWLRQGMLPPGTDYVDMERGFNQGKVAMMIAGPWAWDNLRRSKIDFSVYALPTLNGKPCRPFVGVVGLVLAARSPNRQMAMKFIEEELYSDETQSALFAPGGMRGVPADKNMVRRHFGDRLMRRQLQVIRGGQLMPNTPDMGIFWGAVGTALFNIGLARQSPEAALDNAVRRLHRP